MKLVEKNLSIDLTKFTNIVYLYRYRKYSKVIDLSDNPVFDKFVETGKGLFAKWGFKKLSVEEVCQDAGYSKMTFYKYFENKLELARKVIDSIIDGQIHMFNPVIEGDDGFDEKILKLIQLKNESAKALGPVFVEDILGNVPELTEYLYIKRMELADITIRIYEDGKRQGYIRKNISIQYFMFLLDYLTNMTNEEMFKNMFPDIEERIRESVELFFYGVYDHNENNKEK